MFDGVSDSILPLDRAMELNEDGIPTGRSMRQVFESEIPQVSLLEAFLDNIFRSLESRQSRTQDWTFIDFAVAWITGNTPATMHFREDSLIYQKAMNHWWLERVWGTVQFYMSEIRDKENVKYPLVFNLEYSLGGIPFNALTDLFNYSSSGEYLDFALGSYALTIRIHYIDFESGKYTYEILIKNIISMESGTRSPLEGYGADYHDSTWYRIVNSWLNVLFPFGQPSPTEMLLHGYGSMKMNRHPGVKPEGVCPKYDSGGNVTLP